MMKLLPITLLLAFLSLKAAAGPYISATPQVLNSFNYTVGSGPSASQTVVLQSAIMAISSGTVTVTGTANYEVSLNNSTFTSTVSIPYSGDTLAATNLYIRLKGGLSAGAYNGETIAVGATGISQSISANGFVTSPCIVTTGAITATTAAFTWNATGAASYECKIDQSAAAPVTAGTPAPTTSYSQNGLSSGRAYFFHVRGVGAGNNFTAWTTKAFSTASTGISSTPGSSNSISLAPNPNQGIFTVAGTMSGKSHGIVPISVMNALGQVIYNTTTAPENGAFSRAIELFAPAGLYLIRVGTTSDGVVTRFIIAP